LVSSHPFGTLPTMINVHGMTRRLRRHHHRRRCSAAATKSPASGVHVIHLHTKLLGTTQSKTTSRQSIIQALQTLVIRMIFLAFVDHPFSLLDRASVVHPPSITILPNIHKFYRLPRNRFTTSNTTVPGV